MRPALTRSAGATIQEWQRRTLCARQRAGGDAMKRRDFAGGLLTAGAFAERRHVESRPVHWRPRRVAAGSRRRRRPGHPEPGRRVVGAVARRYAEGPGRRRARGSGSRRRRCRAALGRDVAGRRARHSAAARSDSSSTRCSSSTPPTWRASRRDRDRWLPLFWAIDNFKASQAQNAQAGDWQHGRLPDDGCPAPAKATRSSARRWTTGRQNADRAIARCPLCKAQRSLRDVLALRGPRFPRHRPQGDLRRQFVSHAGDHRLASRRANAAFAGARAPRA